MFETAEMKDVTGPAHITVEIREDGKVLWINDEKECLFRACQIGELNIVDNRPKK